jgi:ankyrin repeat protein
VLSLRQQFKNMTACVQEDRKSILNHLLLQSAQKNDSELCRELLIAGAEPNTKSENETALLIAARNDNPDLIKILLSFGANTEIIHDDDGNTALFSALLNESRKAAHALVDAGADINKTRINNESGLHFAARLGDATLLKKMLSRVTPDMINLQTQNNKLTALHLAIHNNHIALVDCFLEVGAWTDLKDAREETALGATIRLDQPQSCQKLLIAGADPNMAFGKDAEVPLHKAIIMKRDKILSILLRHGADPLLTDGAKRNALCLAAREGDKTIFKTLLQHVSHHTFAQEDYAYALYDACFYKHTEIVKILLKQVKVDPNIRTVFNKCALEAAVESNQLDITAELLCAGAKTDALNASGQKMVDIARYKGFSDIVQLMNGMPRCSNTG